MKNQPSCTIFLVILVSILCAQAANATPAPVSVTPSSGSGLTQTFTFVFSDPGGATSITSTQIDISATLVAAGACYIYYSLGQNLVYLNNDAGNNWGSGVILGTSATLQNS